MNVKVTAKVSGMPVAWGDGETVREAVHAAVHAAYEAGHDRPTITVPRGRAWDEYVDWLVHNTQASREQINYGLPIRLHGPGGPVDVFCEKDGPRVETRTKCPRCGHGYHDGSQALFDDLCRACVGRLVKLGLAVEEFRAKVAG